jgi:L-glyceraldehyde 3-phosphate reductase
VPDPTDTGLRLAEVLIRGRRSSRRPGTLARPAGDANEQSKQHWEPAPMTIPDRGHEPLGGALIEGPPPEPDGLPAQERPPFVASPARYDAMAYRRVGRSGLDLPAISLGLWQNFGGDRPLETQRAIIRRAFDRGISHFDLANNYGPPYGSAEENFGRILATDLRPYRDELVISTKAGYDMWSGPYGNWGSRKYLLASLDQSLTRLGLDYVDIFYSHRVDPRTPLEETMGALDTAVRQGKALYVGISSYSAERTQRAIQILRQLGTPLLIHQPSYSMLNRWIERGLLDVLEEGGVGCIAFSPLAQGLLTDKYLGGVPDGSRATLGGSFRPDMLSDENLAKVRALKEIARRRSQSLAQMAIAWTLRDPRVTAAVVGASSVAQLDDTLRALENLTFSADELEQIDRHATDSGVNLWESSSSA